MRLKGCLWPGSDSGREGKRCRRRSSVGPAIAKVHGGGRPVPLVRSPVPVPPMAILLFVLFVLLVLTFGLWDTLVAVAGAAAVAILAVLLSIGVLALGAYLLYLRVSRRGSV